MSQESIKLLLICNKRPRCMPSTFCSGDWKKLYESRWERTFESHRHVLHHAERRKHEGRTLVAMIQDLIPVGIETTYTALVNACALLLKHRECALKIQNEIDRVVGTARSPNLSDRPKMLFTRAFILEVLRYTSQNPLPIPHRASEDHEFSGYFVNKDSQIFMNSWFIHHDVRIWGDPWNFRPERFLDAQGHLLSPEHELRQSIVTFSFGKRSCPGEILAMTRIFLYIARILQTYDMDPPSTGDVPNTDPRSYIPGLNIRVQDYMCRITRRMSSK